MQLVRPYVLAFIGLTFLSISCGAFDNSDILTAIAEARLDANDCAGVIPIRTERAVLPIATEGRPWAGWLHAEVQPGLVVNWTAEGLPKGISLQPATGEMWGYPLEAGLYVVTAKVSGGGNCPNNSDEITFDLPVESPCETTCNATGPCVAPPMDALAIAVVVHEVDGGETQTQQIATGQSFAADGLVVDRVNVPLSPSAPPYPNVTHRMDLSHPANAAIVGVSLYYAIPGGVKVPMQGESVDLRYVRGQFDDHYLFLTRDGSTRFVIYDGYLSPEELSRRCQPNYGGHCSVPTLDTLVMECPVEVGCGKKSVLPVDLLGVDVNAGLTQLEVLPGQAAQITNNRFLRLVDSFEQKEMLDCDLDYPVPYRHAFYMLPLGKGIWSYTEIVVDASLPLHASSSAVLLAANVIFPASEVTVKSDWIIVTPQGAVKHQRSGAFVFDSPGDYLITLNAAVEDVVKQFTYPPCGSDDLYKLKDVSAQRILSVLPAGGGE